MKALKRSATALICLLFVFGAARPQQARVPTPSEFLKINVGGDGVLATYEQIVSYWREVGRLSDRVMVEDLGPTTMGHPMINAIISSPANLQKLEYYRDINNRLYDPRKTSPEQAKQLIAEGKTIVAILPDAGERYLTTALFEGWFDNEAAAGAI